MRILFLPLPPTGEFQFKREAQECAHRYYLA
jgi:hypothetical protein